MEYPIFIKVKGHVQVKDIPVIRKLFAGEDGIYYICDDAKERDKLIKLNILLPEVEG